MKQCRYGKRHSIFARLLFVLIVTMLTVHLIIAVIFGRLFNNNLSNSLENNIGHYAEYIIRDIGSPPDTAKVRQYAKDYEFQYRYEAVDYAWTSDSDMPRIAEALSNPPRKMPGPTSTWRLYYSTTFPDGSQAMIQWMPGLLESSHRKFFFLVLVVVTLIFAISHGYTRRILRPIRLLQRGVNQVREGHLDTEVPVVRDDELGALTVTFNDMTRRIKDMLRSRDQLLIDVSHELRSPLTRIRVALEFLPDTEKKAAVLSDISEIEIMITEILETEKLKVDDHGLQKIPIRMRDFLNQIGAGFENRPPGVKVMSVPMDLKANLDPERMKMVMNNVIENALKFSGPDSRPVEISIILDERIRILIRDDGIGIPDSEIPYLFEPFYRADPSRSRETGGYGLGLHICKKIVGAHGGKIEIRNNPDSGVTVAIELPV